MKKFLEQLVRDERGIGTIEIILILVVLVALVLLFKTQILGLVDSIFGHINSSVNEIY
ncbi:MAG: hypothetical protein IKR59_01105 [Lachnospiraceae bacterium]|nr:hypothetical protein [Lachnospiraceae bacterium]